VKQPGHRSVAKTRKGFALWGLVAAIAAGCSTRAPDPNARLDPSAIDEGRLVTLTGNTHPSATPGHLLGPVDDGFLIEHMQLVLQRSSAQEAALEAQLDALHDPTSPQFHQWLNIEQFASLYGVPWADIDVITGWLRAHSLRVDSVPPSRMFIEFSGTAAQVSEAFHTEIDHLEVKGKEHFANVRDPQIPAELAKAVVGVHALHDFMPHPMHEDRGPVKRDHVTGAWSLVKPSPGFTLAPYGGECVENSDCTSGTCNTATGVCTCTTSNQCTATLSGAAAKCNTTTDTCVQCQSNADCFGPSTCNTATSVCETTFYAVGPADFAAIYNLNPLFAAGTTGRGETVVVIEDTLLTNVSDVATFRTAFGLNAYGGIFSQVTATGTTACASSGVNGAEGEAALDAEWAGATAPGAAIELASCKDTATTFGGLVALENLINGANPPKVVSISYGLCEAENGAAGNASYVNTYEQAVALGVSVFVSTGDEGAASCDADAAVATHGIAVSGFASTPYNVAVGGTDFGDYRDSQFGGPPVATYWNATNTASFGSARSYIPEIPWNDSCASQLVYSTPSIALGTYTQGYGATGFCNSTIGKADFRTTAAGSGGPSNYSAQPSWQTGVVGLPSKSGGKRVLPDVSLFAANGGFGRFLVECMSDAAQGGAPCTFTSDADTLLQAGGGTSFAAPSMAGIQALIDQKMGAAQGNPNYTYYKLAAAEQGARGTTRCNSTGGTEAAPTLPDPGCIFNDVTQGDIVVNCTGTDCFGATGGRNGDQGALSSSTTTYTPAFVAGTGWDYATGLGSVNVTNLVNAWSN
jgi:subtilase family serine protease